MTGDRSIVHKLQKLNLSHKGISSVLLVIQLLRVPFLTLCHVPLCLLISASFVAMEIFSVIVTPVDLCASLESVIKNRKWQNLIMSHFCHINEWHVYHNLTGFIRHAVWIERTIGWKEMLKVIFILLLRTQALHLILNHIFYVCTGDESYSKDCYIGISGLVFALNVISNMSLAGYWEVPLSNGSILYLSKSFMGWLDLFLVQFPLPTSSFVGHTAGIMAGLSYQGTYLSQYGPVKFTEATEYESEQDTGDS
ncbi:Rhomboid domain-containing protein 1 [Fasciola hepatica]|uniref:Rhomboid domain-containing protein 1 n=1 Tax=Fasciola hepatica TaxID=6192 RepID=A0A4E0S3X4_FASHE|nr:Rhomboid domain-containing protein 1 [Fasciola hepatica]